MLNLKFLIQIDPGQGIWTNSPVNSLILFGNAGRGPLKCIDLNLMLGWQDSEPLQEITTFQKITEVNETFIHPCFLYLIEGYTDNEIQGIELKNIVSERLTQEHFIFFGDMAQKLPEPHFRPVFTFSSNIAGKNSIIILVHNMYHGRAGNHQ